MNALSYIIINGYKIFVMNYFYCLLIVTLESIWTDYQNNKNAGTATNFVITCSFLNFSYLRQSIGVLIELKSKV